MFDAVIRSPRKALTAALTLAQRDRAAFIVVVGTVIAAVVLVAAVRGDLRSYRDQLTTYVASAEQHDAARAAPYVCASLRSAFAENPERWDRALRDQDAALGGLHLADVRRGRTRQATVVFDRDTGGQITLRIPNAEEDGQLLVCPDLDALYGAP